MDKQTEISPVNQKKRIREADQYTVLIIKGSDRFSRFSLSPLFFWGAALFLTCYLFASIFFINLYFEELRASKSQSERLVQLQRQMMHTKEILEGTRERLQLLNDRISEKTSPPKLEISEKTKLPELEIKSATPETLDPPKMAETFTWTRQGGTVLDVQRFNAMEKDRQLNISFRLVNIDPDNRPVNGYVIVIAMNGESNPPQYWAYPKMTLKEGIPVDFKDGEYFEIRNYRTIRARYAFDSDGLPPTLIRVLAYDESGKLILRKEMPLSQ